MPLHVRHAILAALLSQSLPAEAGQFFCAADLSTGFKFTGTGWLSTNFIVTDMRFTIAPADSSGSTYTVTKLGEAYPTHRCTNDLPPGGPIHLLCGGLGSGFVFNEATLRFQETYGFGFIDGDSTQDTPAITIGKCSSIP
ncbi:hypothetical protein C8D77_117106 [Mesorhizobium loti]|uniref:Secreted protein n=1 Tax=Rhizobium loti TaxID=381 RepID=A0A8E3B295_RHILI|nr:hypothetical protein [Mesorhizobium loti]PWJ87390.1 hypothetical protein C8D77_117106 [Mesorhizobium loti]